MTSLNSNQLIVLTSSLLIPNNNILISQE
uniref:Uncharacterized protein n=1 Tax=Anguilla anguilla TaxID=7936 RepID=A0A0E9TG89_ANGAN